MEKMPCFIFEQAISDEYLRARTEDIIALYSNEFSHENISSLLKTPLYFVDRVICDYKRGYEAGLQEGIERTNRLKVRSMRLKDMSDANISYFLELPLNFVQEITNDMPPISD